MSLKARSARYLDKPGSGQKADVLFLQKPASKAAAAKPASKRAKKSKAAVEDDAEEMDEE